MGSMLLIGSHKRIVEGCQHGVVSSWGHGNIIIVANREAVWAGPLLVSK